MLDITAYLIFAATKAPAGYPAWVEWFRMVCIFLALFGSGLILLQFLLACLGFLDLDVADVDGGDIDVSGDVDAAGEATGDTDGAATDLHGGTFSLAQYLSFRSIIAFCAFFGLVGLWSLSAQQNIILVIVCSMLAGCVASFCITKMMRAMSSLHSDGNFHIENAVGQTGTVYTPIMANQSGCGKIQISIDNQTDEFEAFTDSPRQLNTGEKVKVVKLLNSSTFLVAPLDADEQKSSEPVAK